MAESDETAPYDEIKLKATYVEQMESSIAGLKAAGLDEEAADMLKTLNSIKRQQKPFLSNAADRVATKAQMIERSQVGHSASGYVPTGTLRKSIKPTITDDSTAQIKAGAQTKKGYNYGNAVEFGTFKQAAEPFLGPAINQSQDANEKDADEFLKRGVEQNE